MKLRPYIDGDAESIDEALELATQARHALTVAGAKKAADKIRAAIRSIQGAKRHVDRLRFLHENYIHPR